MWLGTKDGSAYYDHSDDTFEHLIVNLYHSNYEVQCRLKVSNSFEKYLENTDCESCN